MELKVQSLTKAYKDRLVLRNISFTVSTGEIVGFIGNNGAGKTTTIKCIFQELNYKAGTITIDGKKIGPDMLQDMAFFPDQNNFPKNYKIVAYCKYIYKLSGGKIQDFKRSMREILESLNLIKNKRSRFRQLSSGMQKRALLASVLITRPKIIVLDEPTANVDVATRKEFIDVLQMLAQRKQVTIMITSHDIEELDTFVNKVVLLDKGQVVYNAPFDRKTQNLSEIYHQYISTEKGSIDNQKVEQVMSGKGSRKRGKDKWN
jgi:ABC-2 type transport system ATP-binding protein